MNLTEPNCWASHLPCTEPPPTTLTELAFTVEIICTPVVSVRVGFSASLMSSSPLLPLEKRNAFSPSTRYYHSRRKVAPVDNQVQGPKKLR